MRTVIFNEMDSWEYYNMLTLSLDMPEPSVRIITETIAGRDGSIDFTEAISGAPNYDDRKGNFSFRIVGDNCKEQRDRFVSDVHGKKMPVKISDELRAYFGRCEVNTKVDKGYYVDLTVSVLAEPYKMATEDTEVTETISGSGNISALNSGDSAVVPTITTDGGITIIFDEWTYTVEAGTHKMPFTIPPKSESVLAITGDAEVTVAWRERYL